MSLTSLKLSLFGKVNLVVNMFALCEKQVALVVPFDIAYIFLCGIISRSKMRCCYDRL